MALTKIPTSLLDASSHIDPLDNERIRLGTGNDLQLYHNGSNSFITNSTNDLYLDTASGSIHFTKGGTSEVMASFNTDSSVTLRHDNSIKFATTSTGASVTGYFDVSDQVLVGTNDSIFQENNLRFKSSGAAYIDHNTTGQVINFRVSNSSSLDTTPLVVKQTGVDVAGDLAVTGDLNITGDVNSVSVTDLDVVDKTITLGKGQTEGNSGGSGIVVDGSSASILWDESNSTWDFNKALDITGTLTHSSNYTQTAGTWTKQGTNGNVQIASNGNELNFTRNAANYINASGGSSSTLKILQNGGHVLTVSTGKNIGIGTESPARKLTVQGGSGDNLPVRIVGGSGTSHGSLEFQDPNTTADYKVTIGSKTDDFYIQAGGTEKVRFKSSGDVGIGTTTPQGKLDVDGDLRVTANIVSNTVYQMLSLGSDRTVNDYGGLNKDYWRMNIMTPGPNTDGGSSAHAFGTLIFSGVTGVNTTYADRLAIEAGGNVGIGTSNPGTKLHVYGGSLKIENAGASDNSWTYYVNGDRTYLVGLRGSSNDKLSFYDLTADVERMSITSSGHVGVNVASPGTGSSSLTTFNVGGAIMTHNSGNGSGRHYVYEQRYAGSNNLTMGYIANGSTHTHGFVSSQNNLALVLGVGTADNIVCNSNGSISLAAGMSVGDTSTTVGAGTGTVITRDARVRATGGRGGQPNPLGWDHLNRANSSFDDGSPISSSFNSAYGVNFSANGGGTTNHWVQGEGPGGGIQWLWRGASTNPSNSSGQGGWDCGSIGVDSNYSYMLVNYVKRISSASTGTYYFGTQSVFDHNGNSLNNPYMTITGTSNLPRGVWCCDVQFIVGHQYTGNVATANTGLFRMDTGAKIQGWASQFSGVNQYRNHTSSSNQVHIGFRTYLYYATANDGTTLYWAQPAVYKCDGTEPTLGELRGQNNALANNNV